jgi:hypothetical protein
VFEQAGLGRIRADRLLSEGPRLDLPRRRNRHDCLCRRLDPLRRFDYDALALDDLALMFVNEHLLHCYGRRRLLGGLPGKRRGFTIGSGGLNDVPRWRIQNVFGS